jgi:membrane associated rhomboid family serine protease
MLQNIPQVTKNLLILNILMFLVKLYFQYKQIDIDSILGGHYVNSPLFEPYQVVSYFFMHGDFFHLFVNMFGLVMFGSFLERLWGPKRYFIFYVATAIGAFALYNAIGVIEIQNLKSQIVAAGLQLEEINDVLKNHEYFPDAVGVVKQYQMKCLTPMMGASGAIFGISAAFAILFPNTELMLLFPPIPIKAKFLIGGYFIYEVYRSIYQVPGDNVAHLAHVGGAIVGAIIVLIWRRKSNNFY